ncbi:MAG: TonB family protein [Woeseiaceae bacterium]|nr:TonB family protein [Woeseiaceae bacterium]NIP19846.1 TonB family protein [Woeseiaceae bacterium]NIS88647.1 TonB family protein [Woeseiaceae bacterium]
MSPIQSSLITTFLVCFANCAIAQFQPISDDKPVFEKPLPEYPESEYVRGHEGWVMVGFQVERSGLVSAIDILESSGREAFDKATLSALQDWRFTPGEAGSRTALVNFQYERTYVQLSRRFMSLNDRVHKQIDKGNLDAAENVLADMRNDHDLTVFELAYSYLTEGRIASESGDLSRQLALFRKAIRNDGRWLARENYLSTLRAIIILEIDLQDYGSAVRDYELLAKTSVGRKMGEDLEQVIGIIRKQLDEIGIEMQPYMVADNQVSVKRDRPGYDSSISQPPINPRGNVKPSKPPAKKN